MLVATTPIDALSAEALIQTKSWPKIGVPAGSWAMLPFDCSSPRKTRDWPWGRRGVGGYSTDMRELMCSDALRWFRESFESNHLSAKPVYGQMGCRTGPSTRRPMRSSSYSDGIYLQRVVVKPSIERTQADSELRNRVLQCLPTMLSAPKIS